MNFENLVRFAVVVGSASLALTGCSVDAAEPAEPSPATATTAGGEEDVGQSALALKAGGGGGGNAFSCGALGCICHGDWDCNNMFDGGACGTWPAKCYERGPGPVYCICAPWVGKAAVMSGAGAVGGAEASVLRP